MMKVNKQEQYRLSAIALCRRLLLPYDASAYTIVMQLHTQLPEYFAFPQYLSIPQLVKAVGADAAYAAATLLGIEWNKPSADAYHQPDRTMEGRG